MDGEAPDSDRDSRLDRVFHDHRHDCGGGVVNLVTLSDKQLADMYRVIVAAAEFGQDDLLWLGLIEQELDRRFVQTMDALESAKAIEAASDINEGWVPVAGNA